MVVEHTIRSADYVPAIAFRVPCHSYARLDVVLVSLDAFLKAKIAISGLSECGGWFEFGRNLHVITQSVVQGEVVPNAPGVLPEESHRRVVEGIGGTAEALNEISGKAGSVGLHGGEIRESKARTWIR